MKMIQMNARPTRHMLLPLSLGEQPDYGQAPSAIHEAVWCGWPARSRMCIWSARTANARFTTRAPPGQCQPLAIENVTLGLLSLGMAHPRPCAHDPLLCGAHLRRADRQVCVAVVAEFGVRVRLHADSVVGPGSGACGNEPCIRPVILCFPDDPCHKRVVLEVQCQAHIRPGASFRVVPCNGLLPTPQLLPAAVGRGQLEFAFASRTFRSIE